MRSHFVRVTTLLLLLFAVVLYAAASMATSRITDPTTFTITETLLDKGDDLIISVFQIETRPGTVVRLKADKPLRGDISAAGSGDISKPEMRSIIKFMLFADHVTWKAGATNVLKVQYSLASGGSATTSSTGPMPEGKSLANIIKLTLKPGTYPEGTPVEAFRYNDDTFHLLVEPFKQ